MGVLFVKIWKSSFLEVQRQRSAGCRGVRPAATRRNLLRT